MHSPRWRVVSSRILTALVLGTAAWAPEAAALLPPEPSPGLWSPDRPPASQEDRTSREALTHYLRAKDLHAEQQFEKAGQEYRRALELDPDLEAARQGLHQAEREAKRRAWVETADTTTLQSLVGEAERLYAQGQAWEAHGQLNRAVAAYREALHLIPGYPEVLQALQRLERSSGVLPAAPTTAPSERSRGLLSRPATADTPAFRQAIQNHFLGGCQALDQGALKEAQREFELVLEFDPNHRDAMFKLNETKRRVTRAIHSAEQVAAEAQERGDTLAEMSAVRSIISLDPSHDRAARTWRAAQQQPRGVVDDLYRRGISAYARGRYHEALQAWDLVLELRPEHEKAKESIRKVREKLDLMFRQN